MAQDRIAGVEQPVFPVLPIITLLLCEITNADQVKLSQERVTDALCVEQNATQSTLANARYFVPY